MPKLALMGGEPVNPGLHIRWPQVSERDKEYIMRAVEEGVFWGTEAPQVTALEREWNEFIGSKYTLSCNSGTAALHMAVAAAGIKPGDEVITPSLTFVASAMCVLQHNAIPVFADVDPRTFCIDPKKTEEKITEKTKAIIPVDLHGMACDYDEIMAIAKKYNLVVIADSCQAHGAYYKGRKVGTLADMSVFSMNGLKNLTAGDGGFLNTDNEEYRKKADQLRVFGEIVENPRNYNSKGLGWCYRMVELTAAYARSRLTTLEEENKVRQENGKYLTEQLSDLPGLITPYIPEDRDTVYHYYRIRLDPKKLGLNISPDEFRARVQKALTAEGVINQRWQTLPVQEQDLFIEKVGYGYGCPWACRYASGKEIKYGEEDMVVTKQILADSLCLYDGLYPPNGLDLMKKYSEAFHKIWDNMDELLAYPLDPNDPLLINKRT